MNIESIKRRLLVKYPFFGSVVANSSFIADLAVRTAETDGKDIYYNPNFIESITDDQQTFIFAHEICHIAFDHIFRREGKEKKLWNTATDAVINASLKQDGLPIVKGGVDIPEAINYDAEEMYKKLLEEKQQQQNQSNNQQGDSQSQQDDNNQNQSNGSSEQNSQSNDNQQLSQNSQENGSQDKPEESNDVGHDTHSMWDEAIKKKHQEESSQSSSSSSDKDKTENEQSQQPQSIKREDREKEQKKNEEIKKITELGEKEAFKQNKIDRKKQLEELRKALASQSHGFGNTTNSELRSIKNIGTSELLIDWRRFLKESIKYDVDWSFQNAGIEDGVVTPYLEEQPKPETEIVLDTSGTIDDTLLRNFLRECKNILQFSKVKVGCFDTKFYGFTEIKNVSDIDNLPFYGGGGTNFNVAVNAFTRRVENKIIFTDGEADMPSTPIDAIWVVVGKTKINPAGGKVIYINDKQLEKLCYYQMSNKIKCRSR